MLRGLFSRIRYLLFILEDILSRLEEISALFFAHYRDTSPRPGQSPRAFRLRSRLLKWILSFLVIVAAAAAVWWFWFRGPEAPQKKKGGSSIAAGIEYPVTVGTNPEGVLVLKAESKKDLFYLQGYQDGKTFKKQLLGFRNLLRGVPDKNLPEELRRTAPFFYNLNLNRTAERCIDLYPGRTRLMLTRYAEGLSQASEESWSATDILLLQRGYAFLLGGNWSKHWNSAVLAAVFGRAQAMALSPYANDPPLFGDKITATSDMDALFEGPMLESVRIKDKSGKPGQLFRAQPFWRFAVRPLSLEVTSDFKAQGMALVGLPGLWSGRNEHITFVRQAVYADDERFLTVPRPRFEGRDDLLVLDPGMEEHYDYRPMTTPLGRALDRLVAGQKDNLFIYDWLGFRPSIDLNTQFLLLEATSVDEAVNALQYHQVPHINIDLVSRSGITVSYEVQPKTGLGQSGGTALFDGSSAVLNRNTAPTLGSYFRTDTTVSVLEQDPFLEDKPNLLYTLEQRLKLFMQSGGGYLLSSEKQTQINELLGLEDIRLRRLFLSLVLHELCRSLSRHFLGNTDGSYRSAMQPYLEQLVVEDLARGIQGPLRAASDGQGKNELIAEVLDRCRRKATTNPVETEPVWDWFGKPVSTPLPGGAWDNPGNGFVVQGERVLRASQYFIFFDDNFYCAPFPFQDKKPQDQPRGGWYNEDILSLKQVKPKIPASTTQSEVE